MIEIAALLDPTLEASGHPANSDYVEQCWTPIIGPSSVMMLRRVYSELSLNGCQPYVQDYREFSAQFGMRDRLAGSTIDRLHRFGLAQSCIVPDDDDGERLCHMFRMFLPDVAPRHYHKLPAHVAERFRLTPQPV